MWWNREMVNNHVALWHMYVRFQMAAVQISETKIFNAIFAFTRSTVHVESRLSCLVWTLDVYDVLLYLYRDRKERAKFCRTNIFRLPITEFVSTEINNLHSSFSSALIRKRNSGNCCLRHSALEFRYS